MLTNQRRYLEDRAGGENHSRTVTGYSAGLKTMAYREEGVQKSIKELNEPFSN